MRSIKISIITPCYNHGEYLTDTIESVLNQKYNNFEHIIIDGGSTDNTISILKKYNHLIWISERDKGSADAIKKGINMSTGSVLTWLNADDYFAENTFEIVAKLFNENKDLHVLIGAGTFVDVNKRYEKLGSTNKITANSLLNRSADQIRQPSTFFTRYIYDKVDGINDKLKLVFDYDLFLRMLKITEPKYISDNLSFQRDYETTLSRKYARKQAVEIFNISRANGGRLFSRINIVNVFKFVFKRTPNFKLNSKK